MIATPVIDGDVQQLKPLDALLEQFHSWARLWDELADGHMAERHKLLDLAAKSTGLSEPLTRSWLYNARVQGEFAGSCRDEADRWRKASAALRQTTSHIRRAA